MLWLISLSDHLRHELTLYIYVIYAIYSQDGIQTQADAEEAAVWADNVKHTKVKHESLFISNSTPTKIQSKANHTLYYP